MLLCCWTIFVALLWNTVESVTDRTENSDTVSITRTKGLALQQIAEINAKITERQKAAARTACGSREDYKSFTQYSCWSLPVTPVEVLHTILLGSCKHILKVVMPKMTAQQKTEILARVRAFDMSGFQTRLYGNVCRYYQSFVGGILRHGPRSLY